MSEPTKQSMANVYAWPVKHMSEDNQRNFRERVAMIVSGHWVPTPPNWTCRVEESSSGLQITRYLYSQLLPTRINGTDIVLIAILDGPLVSLNLQTNNKEDRRYLLRLALEVGEAYKALGGRTTEAIVNLTESTD